MLVLILNFSKVGYCYKVANLPLPPFLKVGHFYVEANSIIKINAALESIFLFFIFWRSNGCKVWVSKLRQPMKFYLKKIERWYEWRCWMLRNCLYIFAMWHTCNHLNFPTLKAHFSIMEGVRSRFIDPMIVFLSHHIELESYLLNKFSLNVTQIARYLRHAIPACKKACLRVEVLMSFYECQPHFRNAILQIKA